MAESETSRRQKRTGDPLCALWSNFLELSPGESRPAEPNPPGWASGGGRRTGGARNWPDPESDVVQQLLGTDE